MGPMYGWISQNDQEDNLYFNTTELVSYAGIIEAPCVGDEVILHWGKMLEVQWLYVSINNVPVKLLKN